MHALREVPAGSSILDLPCGTGRLLDTLVAQGFKVHEADSSSHMVEQARHRWASLGSSASEGEVIGFSVEDALQTSFPDATFDAVVCNRLFHHFIDPETRVQAMKELGRISRGPVVLSFFNAATWGALRTRIKDRLRRGERKDRLPIPLELIVDEARRAGLELVESIPSRGRMSPQWYVVLRKPAHATGKDEAIRDPG